MSPRVSPTGFWRTSNWLLPESLLDTRAWGVGSAKSRCTRRERRAQKQRVVPNFCETRPSIRYVNYAYGNLDTTVPRCVFGSGCRDYPVGGVLDGEERRRQLEAMLRWSFSKITRRNSILCSGRSTCVKCGNQAGISALTIPARKRAPLRQNVVLDQSERRNKIRFFLSRCDRFS